jgi:hypothetical protein
MAQLAAWVLVSLVAAWLLRSRPVWAVSLVVVVWTSVPAVAGHRLTGVESGALAFHPASWLIVSILLVQLVVNPGPPVRALARHTMVLLVVAIFAAGALLTSLSTDSGGTRLLMDQIVGPVILWWLIVASADRDHRALLVLRTTIVATMAAQCALVLVQSAVGAAIVYQNDFLQLYWFRPDTFRRWFGTSDSPLVLSLGVAVAAALAIGIRNGLLRFALLVVYLLGMLVTQSRTAVVLMVLVIIVSLLRSRMAMWARTLTAAAVLVTGFLLATSSIIAGVASRVSNDTGSTQARFRAAGFVLDNLRDFLFTGQGLTSSYTIARDAGLETSLESSYLMYVVDTGLLLATLYFGLQLVLVLRYGRQQALVGATLAALIAVLFQHTFSSAAFSNTNGVLIWAALGIMVAAHSLEPGSAGPAAYRRTVDPPLSRGTQLIRSAATTGDPAATNRATSSAS